MPVVCGVPVVATRVLSLCTRGCGCIGHPAFPAPSLSDEGGSDQKLGRNAPRECVPLVSHYNSHVVPADAGTHNHRRTSLSGLGQHDRQQHRPVVMGPRVRGDDKRRVSASAVARRAKAKACPPFRARTELAGTAQCAFANPTHYSLAKTTAQLCEWRAMKLS